MCYPSEPISHSHYGLLQSEKCKVLPKSVIFYSLKSAPSQSTREIKSEEEQAIVIHY